MSKLRLQVVLRLMLRYQHEVEFCRAEQPFEIRPPQTESTSDGAVASPSSPGMFLEGPSTMDMEPSTSKEYLSAPIKLPSGKSKWLSCFVML